MTSNLESIKRYEKHCKDLTFSQVCLLRGYARWLDKQQGETTAEPRPTCLHDPYHANNTLIVESHWGAGSRIRCVACGGCAAIEKKSGAVVPETCVCHSPPKTSSPQCDVKCFDWPKCECGRGMP